MSNRYLNIQVITGSLSVNPRHYTNVIYPEIEPTDQDIYLIATSNDRLDILASDYYQDSTLWWIIASANSLPGNSLYITNGTQIRIPVDVQSALNNFIAINKLR